MEFDDLGGRCQYNDCNQLDYLPFECNLCKKILCLNHKSYDQHECTVFYKKNDIKPKPKSNTNKCHFCNKKQIFEFKCSKCNEYICIQHRHLESHNCKTLKNNSNCENIRKNNKEDWCIIA